jgi:hypothetical protein
VQVKEGMEREQAGETYLNVGKQKFGASTSEEIILGAKTSQRVQLM